MWLVDEPEEKLRLGQVDAAARKLLSDPAGQAQERRPGADLLRPPTHPLSKRVRLGAKVEELLEGCRLIQGRQILALDVLDQHRLATLHVLKIADDGGDLGPAEQGQRSEPAGSGHELVAVAARADDQRLQQAVVANGLCQVADVADVAAMVVVGRVDEPDGDRVDPHGGRAVGGCGHG